MINKYYDYSGSFFMGIFLIIIGIVILIGMEKLYEDIISILVIVFLIISLFNLFKYVSSYKKSNNSLFSCLFNLIISLVFVMIPNISLGLIPFIFSLYLLIIGISNLIMYSLFFINKSNGKIGYFFNFITCFIIALPIMFNPVSNTNTFIVCLAIYLILLGVGWTMDSIVNILPIRTKNNLKRHIRITIPKILEVLIPYSVMNDINRALEVKKEYNYVIDKGIKPDIYVIIHTSNRGVNRAGHMDIFYNGMVMSYGNYDEGSRRFKEIFGDGVLFTCNDISKYINFCIDNSKKTIFLFGISLNDKQKKLVSNKIDELTKNTFIWNYKDDKKYNNGDSYASRLYKKTKAKFYKFKSGKYKTYYVMGSNCCYLVDDILGNSGMDILSINGIITPGTYYDYFNKELSKKNSNVVSKSIYNARRRASNTKN